MSGSSAASEAARLHGLKAKCREARALCSEFNDAALEERRMPATSFVTLVELYGSDELEYHSLAHGSR